MKKIKEVFCKIFSKKDKKNDTGLTVNLPCKVGDRVRLRVCCECIECFMDWDTGTTECPFEDDCPFDDCDNGNEREITTTVTEIFTTGYGWYVRLKNVDIEIPVRDFGRNIFLEAAAAERKGL